MEKRKVVIIGGGTGSIAVINGLKIYPDVDIKVIVNMTDDGGSNQVIRDEFGLLPLSDIRKSIISLADEDKKDLLRTIFTYRFAEGNGLSGHTIGNLIMMALSEKLGTEVDAIKAISELFEIKGTVIPVTTDCVRLCAKYSNGQTVIGEHKIDDSENLENERIEELFLEPNANAFSEALTAIKEAEYIIVGPGDFYTTTMANLIVKGLAEAIQNSPAKFVYITNLMSKKGETRQLKQTDFIKEIVKYVHRKPDITIVNDGPMPLDILKRYQADGEHVIENDFSENEESLILSADLLNHDPIIKDKGDTLPRSYIRHDSSKLGYILYGLIKGFEL
jgi:uncharacterized cofD-like protein